MATLTSNSPVNRPDVDGEFLRILVVDDHASARESMAEVLTHAGYRVDCLGSAIEALQALQAEEYDVVITDLNMPGMNGLELIEKLSHRPHGAQVLMVTAHASVSTAVEAIRLGAFDYIEKPFSPEQIEGLVARAIEHGKLLDRKEHLAASVLNTPSMIGSSAVMREFCQRINCVAPTEETVLITGESGTGKELAARTVHALSRRSKSPLVSLNCPVLSAHLMESELFGHERGAFTGADSLRTGRFELADGGTILLDEISEIELPLQAKLLRVLQERCFERVGSSVTRQIDVRVLATSNRDLPGEVRAGCFREDLYYRLAVVPLHVPPLRQRPDDIPELLEFFVQNTAARLRREPWEFGQDAVDLLMHYRWPGNIRELENIVARAGVLYQGRATSADELRSWLIDPDGESLEETGGDALVGMSLREMERKLIEATLDHFAGHRAKTADALGIGIRTLSGKLKEYGYAPRARRPGPGV